VTKKPFKILGVEHIGVAIETLDGLSDIFSEVLGLEHVGSEKVEDQKVITDIYDTNNGKLEFLQAVDITSPIAKFLNKKGSGMHHIALKVDHLQEALNYLQSKGIQLIDKSPRIGAEGYKIAFLHPKSTAGILIELCEK
tara:strand:- start:1033 stop:1449 length:417 start_codon:yes stop_codon:yes gene_type:complete